MCSGTNKVHRKQDDEIITSPRNFSVKWTKKEAKDGKLKKREQRLTQTTAVLGKKQKITKNPTLASSLSDSETEVVTPESDDSEVDIDESESCKNCREYF